MTPALAFSSQSVPAAPRTAPEASDLFLFAAAALAVWFVRRSLRKRFGSRRPHD